MNHCEILKRTLVPGKRVAILELIWSLINKFHWLWKNLYKWEILTFSGIYDVFSFSLQLLFWKEDSLVLLYIWKTAFEIGSLLMVYPTCTCFQDALMVYKEAIQKMPRQFAPQSLYNMMGKCIVTALERYLRS